MFKFTHIKQLSVAGQTENEDTVYADAGKIIVIDGATALTPNCVTPYASDPQWLSHRLRDVLRPLLDDQALSLKDCLRKALSTLSAEYACYIAPLDTVSASTDGYPSCSISIIRMQNDCIEYLALGDCITMLRHRAGHITLLRDTRVELLDKAAIAHMRALQAAQHCSAQEARKQVQPQLIAHRRQLNTPGGYWGCTLDAVGVAHAVEMNFFANEIEQVVSMSDGFFQIYDTFGFYQTPADFFDAIHTIGPDALLRRLFAAQDKDPEFHAYPRLKHRDDTSVVIAAVSGP